MNPDFSIVTPSFNGLVHLKRACASLRDQQGPSWEHIVVDAVSTDGTPDWLRRQTSVRAIVEPDEGMYDAVNKGLDASTGEFVAYLNCDEQYLPGTLARVKAAFDANPRADIVFGDCLLTRTDGTLLSCRRAYPLRYAYVAAWQLYVMTASIFLRRRVIDDGFRFDKRFRISGDCDFILRLLKAGYRTHRIAAPLACFAMTGNNLSGKQKPQRELDLERSMAPAWARRLKYPISGVRVVEKFLAGAYRRNPLTYACFTDQNLVTRTEFAVQKPDHRWPAWDGA